MNSTPPSAMMNIWKPRVRESNMVLPDDFVPQPYSVHIGRGKICSEATGNRRLKVIVDSFLQEYRQASTKIEKSVTVSKIVDIIHDACPIGAFVKFQGGKWWEVGDYAAREKVGSMLRDALSEKYRSSSKAKLKRRKQAKKAVYEAAKSNVINEILNIQHDEAPAAAPASSADKKKKAPQQDKKPAATTSTNQTPKMNSAQESSSSLPPKKNLTTPLEAQALRDLQQHEKDRKALQQILSSSTTAPTATTARTTTATATTTTTTTATSFSGSLHSNYSCGPIPTASASNFYDIHCGSSAAVGLQWYSL